MFVGAMGVPGGGRNEVTDRFLRHMQIICLDAFDDNTLNKIFVTILDWHLSKGYVENVARLSKVSLPHFSTVVIYVYFFHFSSAWEPHWTYTKTRR